MALSGSFNNYPVTSFGLWCDWRATQSEVGNYSDVTLDVYVNYWNFSGLGERSASINVAGAVEGYNTPYMNDSSTGWKRKLLKSKTVRVNHNANGEATCYLCAIWDCNLTYSGTYIGRIEAAQTVTLDRLDRVPPTVSFTISDVAEKSFKISATASAASDLWQYSLNGSAWTTFSTTKGNTVSYAFTGLTPGTSYGVAIQARKQSNQVFGAAAVKTTKTLDNAPPTVSFTISEVTATSFKVSATTSVTSDLWQYSLNGSNWTTFSSAIGSTVTHTFTGLTTNTSYGVAIQARKQSNKVFGAAAVKTTKTLDNTPPTVSFVFSDVTATSFKISATASTTSDLWQYSLNGSAWTTFSTTKGSAVVYTFASLTPNTSYGIAIRARKQSNQVYGATAVRTTKTLGGSILTAAANIAADNSTATMTVTATVYNSSYTHSARISIGGSAIVTVTGITLVSGTPKAVDLSAAQRTALLSAMSKVKTITAEVSLYTYSGSTQIGNISVRTVTLTTSAANSAPTFTSFAYADTNAAVVAVSGSNQVLLQTISTLRVTAQAATAKNNSSISSYTVTAGNKVVTATTTVLDIGSIVSSGTLTISVAVVDSRGYTTTVKKDVTVVAYKQISTSSLILRRINNVEATCEINIKGNFSPVAVNNVNKNTFNTMHIRYKKTNETGYSSWKAMTADVISTVNGFSYINAEYLGVSFDTDFSYDVQFSIKDLLGSVIETVVLPQGTPLISLRQKKVGINNRNPQSVLDVGGDIRMNGFTIMGLVNGAVLPSVNLNTIVSPGIYFRNAKPSANLNFPVLLAGMLEVISQGTITLQRYTLRDSPHSIYIRSYIEDVWGEWAIQANELAILTLPASIITVNTDFNIANIVATIQGCNLEVDFYVTKKTGTIATSGTTVIATITGTGNQYRPAENRGIIACADKGGQGTTMAARGYYGKNGAVYIVPTGEGATRVHVTIGCRVRLS